MSVSVYSSGSEPSSVKSRGYLEGVWRYRVIKVKLDRNIKESIIICSSGFELLSVKRRGCLEGVWNLGSFKVS